MRTFLVILVIALVTAALRLLPIYLFGRKGSTLPGPVLDLTRALPGAVIAFLVVYSFKGIQFTAAGDWLPSLLGALLAALLQYWKKNTLLSIFSATVLYMVLIRVM